MKLTTKMIRNERPARYTVVMSHTGLIVTVQHKLEDDWDKANKVVRSMARKFKLAELGAGTDLFTGVRDWRFISKNLEKKMLAESKDLLKHMKTFFKKWGNTYYESIDTYEVIDSIHAMVETDEN